MSQEYYESQRQLEQDQPDSTPPLQAHRWHSAHQPSYSYRDQSLYPTQEAQTAIMARSRRFHMLRRLIQIGFVLLPFVGVWILTSHYAATYSSYLQGSCTISSAGVKEIDTLDRHGSISGRSYYPQLSYEVHAANGTQATAMGYDGPTAQRYSALDAQNVVDQYQVGQNVPCWYNPVAPERAFIVFDGFTLADAAKVLAWGFLGFGAFALLLYRRFDWTLWRLFALHKRGVVTQGRVSQIKKSRTRYGLVHYTPIVSFQALEESGRMRTIKASGYRDVGTLLPVCYDPIFPRYGRTGEWPSLSSLRAGAAAVAVLSTIGLVLLLVVWFIP